jgi:proteasome lid subunit RPN8/RPN11
MRSARAQSLEIIGIYHFHPDHPAVASETDGLRPAGGHRQLAWPQYFYVIVSVIQGQATDCRCWQLDATEQMRPVALQILP